MKFHSPGRVRGPVVLLPSKEPLFASHAEQKGRGVILYYDRDGVAACVNVLLRVNGKVCTICGNCCLSFLANEDATYTCSACGKFNREELLTA